VIPPIRQPEMTWGQWVLKGAAHWLFNAVPRAMARFSPVGDKPVFDKAAFPWVAEVESCWPAIRGEAEDLLASRSTVPNVQDIMPSQRFLSQDDRWKTFFFYAYGRRFVKNCALCPATAAAVERIPGMTTALFSILAGGKYLPEHRGPYKGVLRFHLGLVVPEPKESCGLRVAGHVLHWEEGRGIVFDDVYKHDAWNFAQADRVVLFVDFERPLPAPFAQMNRLLIRLVRSLPLIQEVIRRMERVAPLQETGAPDQ